MRSRKHIFILLLISGLAVIAAGCGRKDTRVTLRFTSWGNDVEEVRLRGLIDTFEKRHPNIRIELQNNPWPRMLDKLMISSAGGRPPDVARVSSEWFQPLAAKGLLEPLDGWVKRDHFDLQDFYPKSIEAWGRYRGVLYELPTDIDVWALYYNKDMFDKYHQPCPDWTWDRKKLIEVATKLTRDTDGDGRLDQWGYAPEVFWQTYIYANGGTVLSKDLKKCTLDQPAAYEGLQFMSDLVNKYHITPTPEDEANLGTLKLFCNGKIAMLVSGSWAAGLIFPKELKGFTYDVAPLPKGPKARCTFIGGAAYAMLSRSQHKKEAWQFLKFMTSKEYMRGAAIQSQIVPGRISVAESGAFLHLNAPPKHRKVFLDMIDYGMPRYAVPCYPEMNQIISSELDLVRLGKEPAKTACKKLTPVIDELLRHQ